MRRAVIELVGTIEPTVFGLSIQPLKNLQLVVELVGQCLPQAGAMRHPILCLPRCLSAQDKHTAPQTRLETSRHPLN